MSIGPFPFVDGFLLRIRTSLEKVTSTSSSVSGTRLKPAKAVRLVDVHAVPAVRRTEVNKVVGILGNGLHALVLYQTFCLAARIITFRS